MGFMSNNLSNPFKSTCAVCLGTFHLQGQKEFPIRHGFTAHNIHHGQTGGWHTGQCNGTTFPHLGKSVEGTVWALGQIKAKLALRREALAGLEARPALTWAFRPNRYDRNLYKYVPDMTVFIERMLTPGTEESLANYRQEDMPQHQSDHQVRVPSYERELASRIESVKLDIRSLMESEATYAEVIRTWQPFDKVAAVKVEMVHKQINRQLSDGRKFSFASCNRRIKAGRGAKMTENDAEVTCKRCQGH